MKSVATALVISDDRKCGECISYVLGQLGVSVLPVVRLDSPWVFPKGRPLSLIVLHFALSEPLPGFDKIRVIRAVHGTDIPIVLMSEWPDRNGRRALAHALELGANDFVPVSVDRSLLAAKLCRYLKSNAMAEYELTRALPPEGRIRSRLGLDCEVQKIDEYGVSIVGKHLLPKGTVLRLEGAILQEILGTSDSVITTVRSNWVDGPEALYGAYAGFDPENSHVKVTVRRWLAGIVLRSEKCG